MPEWTCGHTANNCCAECYRALAARAHELAEENFALRDNTRHDQNLIADLLHLRRALRRIAELDVPTGVNRVRALAGIAQEALNENVFTPGR